MAEQAIAIPEAKVQRRWRLPHDWRSQTAIFITLCTGALFMLLPFWSPFSWCGRRPGSNFRCCRGN